MKYPVDEARSPPAHLEVNFETRQCKGELLVFRNQTCRRPQNIDNVKIPIGRLAVKS